MDTVNFIIHITTEDFMKALLMMLKNDLTRLTMTKMNTIPLKKDRFQQVRSKT